MRYLYVINLQLLKDVVVFFSIYNVGLKGCSKSCAFQNFDTAVEKGYRLNKNILSKRLAVVQILHQVNEYKKQKVQHNPEKWCHLGQSNQNGQCSIFDPDIIHLKDHSPFGFEELIFN